MTAHHFFVEPHAVSGGIVTIEGDEAHHAARVLRVRVGEAITVADDTGRVLDAVVSSVGDVVRAEVLKETIYDESKPSVTLYQALTKGEKFEDVVQKVTEIGVARIAPFVAERSTVSWDAGKRSRACERWTAVARAAAKQSKSPRIPAVDEVADGVGVVLREPGPKWVFHESDQAVPLRRVLTKRAPDTLALIVGPEGGFSEAEIDELRQGGADAVWLGPRILRTQTAGLVAASVVSYVYGHMG